MDQFPLPPNNQYDNQQYNTGNEPQVSKGSTIKKLLLIFIVVAMIIGALAVGGFYFVFKDVMSQFGENSPLLSNIKTIPTPAPTLDPNLDSDNDGIPDRVEKAIGTKPDKMDSDSDGYNDLPEIKNNYSPVIGGSVGKLTPDQLQDMKNKIKAADVKFYESVFGSVAATPTFTCGTSTVNDVDNNVYNTVKIGDQCWLKENLKVTKSPDSKAITRYCYNNDPKICDTDGGLYDWNTAMNNSTTEGVQGICPNDWHVPNQSEWRTLASYLKDPEQTCSLSMAKMSDCDPAGTKLKQKSSSGFEGLLSGYIVGNGLSKERNSSVGFWSSDYIKIYPNEDKYYSACFYLTSSMSKVLMMPCEIGSGYFSVRCIKD